MLGQKPWLVKEASGLAVVPASCLCAGDGYRGTRPDCPEHPEAFVPAVPSPFLGDGTAVTLSGNQLGRFDARTWAQPLPVP